MPDWLPEPEPGTSICAGFDGSDVDDWTALRAETRDGLLFTPRTSSGEPTIWNPSLSGGRVPRGEVGAAIDRLFARFDVRRLYCDPPRWETDVELWSLAHGEDRVVEWPTYRTKQMHEALERFASDLASQRITQDGCPLTAIHLGNARRVPKAGDRYILGKPSQPQKIDAAMATVLAHEAAADMRAAGWVTEPTETYFRLPR
jgi:phage terminase large subunit-like protein